MRPDPIPVDALTRPTTTDRKSPTVLPSVSEPPIYRSTSRAFTLGSIISLLIFACSPQTDEPAHTTSTSDKARPLSGVRFVAVPSGTRSAKKFITATRERMEQEGRQTVVYVGAPWCAPCVLFADAVKAGKLNQRFPKLNLVKFDYDRHRAILEPAGYLSNYVPLFALPKPDGSSSERRFMGASRGQGGLRSIVTRLKRLLSEGRE